MATSTKAVVQTASGINEQNSHSDNLFTAALVVVVVMIAIAIIVGPILWKAIQDFRDSLDRPS